MISPCRFFTEGLEDSIILLESPKSNLGDPNEKVSSSGPTHPFVPQQL